MPDLSFREAKRLRLAALRNKMREMARAGHCFVDHTLEHRASDWGEKPNEAEWLRQTTESLRRFREAGIDVHGWWQPGGPGAKYTPAIRNFLTEHYVLTVHAVVVGGNFADSPTRELVRQAVTIGKSWQPIALEIVVPERTDRLAIRVSPAQDGFFLAAPSFRRVP